MANLDQAHKYESRPRPWLTRDDGECAFPMEGERADIRSCCKPCQDRSPYCPEHRRRMKGPRAKSVDELLREYARFLA